jgi:hypothetical protein
MSFQFDIGKVVNDMLQASLQSLLQGGQKAIGFATHEYGQFIRDIDHIQKMAEQGTITAQEAQSLVDDHKASMKAVLITVEGLGIIAVQNAINAALKVLTDALSTAVQGLKFAL